MKRTLHLRRETLGALSDDDLNAVVGGWVPSRNGTGLVRDCLTPVLTYDCVVTVGACTTETVLPTACRCHTQP